MPQEASNKMCMLSLVIFQYKKKNVNTVSLQNIKKVSKSFCGVNKKAAMVAANGRNLAKLQQKSLKLSLLLCQG